MLQHHYERAAALAEEQNYEGALEIVESGLEQESSSELLLLAAILAQRLERYDTMRQYVSLIPVDDSLREEGEWLLRSHQARLRRARERAQAVQHSNGTDAIVRSEPVPLGEAPATSAARLRFWPATFALVFVALAGWATWNWIASPSDASDASARINEPAALPTAPITTPGETTVAPSNMAETIETTAPSDTVPTPLPADASNATETNTGDSGDTVNEQPAEAPAPEIPDDVVLESSTPPPLADTDESSAAQVLATKPFDVLAYLRDAGRPDLAELPLDAQLQEGILVIFGVVNRTLQRREILEMAANVDGVSEINSVNLVVRLPETYTVQEGDTLWIIAYELYDDPARWEDIYEANRDLLPQPESLRTGMTLAVPPAN